MLIFIDNKNGIPIYDQIVKQIKALIISGSLKENEMLPSIRSLAKELRISVITTKRAYEELERQGFVYTVPSKGCFVAKQNIDLLREENLKKIEQHIREVVLLSKSCGLTAEEIIELVKIESEGSL